MLVLIVCLVSISAQNITDNNAPNITDNNTNRGENNVFPVWLTWTIAAILFILVGYFLCTKVIHDARYRAPLLGGQYNAEGQPLGRQDLEVGDSETKVEETWECDICDFTNKKVQSSCVLCGTEKDFNLGLTDLKQKDLERHRRSVSNGSLMQRNISFNRQRSFAIRRINMLNSRQRGARQRHDWIRQIGPDGKRYWARKEKNALLNKNPAPPNKPLKSSNDKTSTETIGSDESRSSAKPLLTTEPSLAFVSRLAASAAHPEGKLQFTEYREADAAVASRGYDISTDDLEMLETVAALPFKEKYTWFLGQTAALAKPWEEGHLKMRINRENILVESMEQLLGVQLDHLHMPLRIEFIGEAGIDAGGLEREWYELLTQALFDETIGLFMLAHVDSLAYVFNPNSGEASVDHLLYYRGAGRLLGRALLEGQFMQAHLALPVLKHLLGVPISFKDLEFVDDAVFKSLTWIKENTSDVAALCLDFSITRRKLNGDIEIIDLKPNGREIDVTPENAIEYTYLQLRFIMLNSFSGQLQHLMAGLFEVIPQELILIFDYQELELVLCGVPSIDVADWQANTQRSDDLQPELESWFWEIVTGWSDEERARLLQFTTGSSRVPVQGFKALTSYDGRVTNFTLKAVPYPTNAYPRAHTCFNRIDLPLYKTKEMLEEVLSIVINMEVTGFTDE